MKIIARIHNAYDEKFGVPRQSGLAQSLEAAVVFDTPYRSRVITDQVYTEGEKSEEKREKAMTRFRESIRPCWKRNPKSPAAAKYFSIRRNWCGI